MVLCMHAKNSNHRTMKTVSIEPKIRNAVVLLIFKRNCTNLWLFLLDRYCFRLNLRAFFLFIHPIHRFAMMKNIADDLSRYGSDPSQLKILERRDFAIEDQKSTNYSIKTLRLKIVFKRS